MLRRNFVCTNIETKHTQHAYDEDERTKRRKQIKKKQTHLTASKTARLTGHRDKMGWRIMMAT
jgi:hypothetical protein